MDTQTRHRQINRSEIVTSLFQVLRRCFERIKSEDDIERCFNRITFGKWSDSFGIAIMGGCMGTSRDQSVPVGSGDGLNISAGGNIYGRIDTIHRPAFAQYQLWRIGRVSSSREHSVPHNTSERAPRWLLSYFIPTFSCHRTKPSFEPREAGMGRRYPNDRRTVAEQEGRVLGDCPSFRRQKGDLGRAQGCIGTGWPWHGASYRRQCKHLPADRSVVCPINWMVFLYSLLKSFIVEQE